MIAFAIALVVAYVATILMARRSPRAWLDAPSGPERARKPQARGVPAVGGAAVIVAVVVAHAAALVLDQASVFVFREGASLTAGLATLFLAALLGTVDDLRGLVPWQKLAAQGVCVLPVASSAHPELALGVLVAMNLANTWDHHDGALASLGLAGFCGSGSLGWAGALAGFLPKNLDASRGEGATPTAYLGDAGSHLVGAALALVPGAAWCLVVPALDLARLCVVRWRVGSRPWVGDRRHLSHLLAERIPSRRAVALVTTLVAVPAILGGRLGGAATTLGVVATVALYLGALWFGQRLSRRSA